MGRRDRRSVGPDPRAGGALPADRPWLMVFRAGSSERILLPDEGEATLGSGSASTVLLEGPGVSPVHATLRLGPAEVLLAPSPGATVLLNDDPLPSPRCWPPGTH